MKLLRMMPAILFVLMGGQFFISEIGHGNVGQALRVLVVPGLIVAFVVWREWKIVRDPEFAARQARKETSPFNQARLAGAICLGLFLGPALALLCLIQFYPHMLDGITITDTQGMILLYAVFILPLAVALWRYVWVSLRVSRQP